MSNKTESKLIPHVIAILIMCTVIYSCKSGGASNSAINPLFSGILKLYHVGDTMIYKDLNGNYDTFTVSSIDSIVNQQSKLFINAAVSKEIYIRYRQIPNNQWERRCYEHDETTGKLIEKKGDNFIIAVTYYRDSMPSEISIQFMNFFQSYSKQLPKENHNTIKLNERIFTNYTILSDENNVGRQLYFNYEKGIIGYKDDKGNVWSRW